jgi:hypothetical protein
MGSVPWPTWEQAFIACLISLIALVVVQRFAPPQLSGALAPAFNEFALIAGLYGIWRLARMLPITHEAGALDRARAINDVQQAVGMPSEISLQHFVLKYEWFAQAVNGYYAIVHVPALIAFLIWAFVFHRDAYPRWRNGLVAVTAGCLVIRFVRVAPPRFIEELGFVDLSTRFGLGVYGDVGTGISDQYAAMPSIHIAWAAVVALGVFFISTHPIRWVVVMHLPVTFFVVAATGHHWWLDGLVAVALLAAGLAADAAVRRRRLTPAAVGQ